MPRWPGPLFVIGGALLALGGISAAFLVADGQVIVDDPRVLAWLALLGAVLFVAGLIYSAVRQIRIRRHLPPERYRGPAVLLLLVLVLVLVAVVTAPFGTDATALLLGDGELTLAGAIVLLLSMQVALLLVSWAFVFRPRALVGWPSWSGPDPAGAVRSGLGWGVLGWIGATIASAAMVALLEALGIEIEPQATEQALRTVEPWLAIVAIVLLAPIAEEIFFRGIVFNAWLREGGRRWAYLGSSALFAAIHLSLVALVPFFLIGLALAWVYRRTGNLLAPIAMHATVNGISVALALLIRFDVIRLPV